jgi:hypothetical protein
VGIVGFCREGQGILECLMILPGREIVLYEPAGAAANPYAQSPGILTVDDWRQFLSGMRLDVVLFLDGGTLDRSQLDSALKSELRVGVLPPLGLETLDRPSFSESPDLLRLLNRHREDADFQKARTWILSQPLEPDSAIKRLSWVADLIEPDRSETNEEDGWFSGWLWEDLDQLLVLTGEMPLSVFAADFSETRECYSLILKFPEGVTAQLERRRSALVPLEMGWSISSGFANGRQHLRTEAGEIYDVPILDSEGSGSDPLAVFDRSEETDSWKHALDVLRVQAAIHKSADSGQPERLT